jgi:hypothetical protein
VKTAFALHDRFAKPIAAIALLPDESPDIAVDSALGY